MLLNKCLQKNYKYYNRKFNVFKKKNDNNRRNLLIYIKCNSCNTSRKVFASDIDYEGNIAPKACECGGKNKVIYT